MSGLFPVGQRAILSTEDPQNAHTTGLQLWNAYLLERQLEVRGLALDNPRVVALNNTFERALVTMHKMPRIWLNYLEHLVGQCLVTQTRRAFDRSLCSLPITQHDRIWILYLARPLTFLLEGPSSDLERVYIAEIFCNGRFKSFQALQFNKLAFG